MQLAARVAHARLLLERWNFLARFPATKWLILVDLRARILMAVVSTDVDGWRGRIVGLKRRWTTTIVVFFQPDEAEKTMTTTGVFLYSRGKTFLWWCGGWRRPESGDRMRERASPTRGERESEIMLRYECVYGTPVPMNTVHRWISDETIGWLWLARSAGWSTVWMSGALIWCGAVHRKLGTPDDVAQLDQILEYFKGWDVSGYIWYFSNCFF